MTGMISLKEYSNVFRYLYNSSYLSRKNSEKILQLLSETDFIGGIRQPIPEDIIVSHKFGYFSPNNNIDTKMFNQCGIIYQEKNPYLLCVSIRSKANSNEEFQNNVMHSEELSQIIYDYLQ